ncbi:MAG: PilT/PilU family type 4a pilus ATPase [Firmicutes bacterium]|jgi:twitching motility protein PilT|nr:PilT/PilU family type 4a pilus ATPase [Bacillota bacterium]
MLDIATLNRLLGQLIEVEGSDLHIKVGSPPRMRINGDLIRLNQESVIQADDMVPLAQGIMHAKLWANFEAHHECDFAYSVPHLGRFRVNAFRQRGSIGMVFRRVNSSTKTLDELGLPPVVRKLSEEKNGIVLVTGPTGSGKTTTLGAMIGHINKTRECHIVTIEDPIEILHRDELAAINQREVGFDTESFITALRSSLREDPDIILIGEMRDPETVATALTAAETGHLVLSTLHTIDSVETINRIIDFFPENRQQQARLSLAGSLRGTICQRLIPRADGKGRIPALEIMVVNGRIQQCILDPNRTSVIPEIVNEGEYYGMQSFAQALMDLLKKGIIDTEQAIANAPVPQDLRVMLRKEGMAVSVI